MRQLFQNMIGNALKFHRLDTPPLVRVTSRLVEEPPPKSIDPIPRQCCEIQFQDNGIGFEQEYADRIFDLFQRLHGREEYEGTGMGLAICRKIVDRHGGRIAAAGAPGQGATFTVVLPVQQAEGGTE
jgi:signal transduction histidine kinase